MRNFSKNSLKILKILSFRKKKKKTNATNYRSARISTIPFPLPHQRHPQRFYFKARNRSCCSSKENLARPLYPQRRTSRPIMDSPHSSKHKGGKHTAGLRPLSGERRDRKREREKRREEIRFPRIPLFVPRRLKATFFRLSPSAHRILCDCSS